MLSRTNLKLAIYIFTSHEVCRNTKLQTLQYRILHRIIPCNRWLHTIKIKDSPDCTVCKETDTINHFFFRCTDVQQLQQRLTKWWKDITNCPEFSLSEPEIMFGVEGKTKRHNALNFIIILLKKYINDTKLTSQPSSFITFLFILKQSLYYEREIYIKSSTESVFDEKWKWVADMLQISS